MCLLVEKTKGVEYSVAEADIICYKVLFKNKIDGSLSTPYRNSYVVSGVEFKSDLELVEYPNTKSNYNHVTIGLHSIDSLSDAKLLLSCMFARRNAVIFKCVIPKGSSYYQGMFKAGRYGHTFYELQSYASDTLTYLEQIYPVVEEDKIFNELLKQ